MAAASSYAVVSIKPDTAPLVSLVPSPAPSPAAASAALSTPATATTGTDDRDRSWRSREAIKAQLAAEAAAMEAARAPHDAAVAQRVTVVGDVPTGKNGESLRKTHTWTKPGTGDKPPALTNDTFVPTTAESERLKETYTSEHGFTVTVHSDPTAPVPQLAPLPTTPAGAVGIAVAASEKDKKGDTLSKRRGSITAKEVKEIAATVGPFELHPEHSQTDSHKGLTPEQVAERQLEYGPNELAEKKMNPCLKFLSYFTGSIAYLIEAACILSAALEDWTDFGIILALLIVNALIGFIEEARAENAVEALRKTLSAKSNVIRGGKIVEIESRELVPGDIVILRIGDVIPADCRLLGITASGEHTDNALSIDQSALTGESLPVERNKGEVVYSSAIIKQGQMRAVVTHTGSLTFIGRAAHLIANTEDSGHFQAVVHKIGNFLIAITLVLVIIILIVALAKGENFLHQLQYALVITIASIPVGLPTVLSVTMAVGAKDLSRRGVIVKRLTAVEEMAGVDVLCSDKTGTLTLNQLSIQDPWLPAGKTFEGLLLTAFLASEPGTTDAIEACVRRTAVDVVPELKGVELKSHVIPGYKIISSRPFDPVAKLTRAVVQEEKTGLIYAVAKGADKVIIRLCHYDGEDVQAGIRSMAARGLRALGVAMSEPIADPHMDFKDIPWRLAGILSLLDPPRIDSGETIRRCNRYGLSVKMLTGDAQLIAKEVAKRLGMQRNILDPSMLKPHRKPSPQMYLCTQDQKEEKEQPMETDQEVMRRVHNCDGLAHVVPEDKFKVVELLQGAGSIVAMTGDGVNDAPALKKANVGIAVHGCTDAARSAADIVLLKEGLSTIVDGITTSRAIFQRMRSYVVYRITSTVHFLLFLFVVILAHGFSLPAKLIVLIALLNDAAVLVISVDNAVISQRPDKWRIGQLLVMSVVLGLLLCAASFGHFYIFRDHLGATDDQLGTVMYLQMSSCPHFVIFSTRVPGPWFLHPPALIFAAAIIATQIFALFISVYGVIADAPIGWAWGGTIFSISVVYFMLMDWVKCVIYKYWNFELTATLWPTAERRKKLHDRRVKAGNDHRIHANIRKVKRVVHDVVGVARRMRHYKPLPEAKVAAVVLKH